MGELTDERLAEYRPVHKVLLDDNDTYVFVRTLTASDLIDLASLENASTSDALAVTFNLLISDEAGNRRYTNGDAPEWPIAFVKAVVEQGMILNGLSDDVADIKKK